MKYQKDGGKPMVTTEENEAAKKEAEETPPEHELKLKYYDVAFSGKDNGLNYPLRYALLEVKPNPGINLKSFGLSFYKSFSDKEADWKE
ncbi:MAG: hypothetical protein PVI21_04965 [Candidatus Woesebacteria bacterium]